MVFFTLNFSQKYQQTEIVKLFFDFSSINDLKYMNKTNNCIIIERIPR